MRPNLGLWIALSFVWLLGAATGARAFPSTPSWDYCPSGYCTNNTTGLHAPVFSNGQAALDDYTSKEPWNGYKNCTLQIMSGSEAAGTAVARGTSCDCAACGAGSNWNTGNWFHMHTYGICPANSTKSGSGTSTICTCNSGYTEDNGSCVQSCPANSTWNGTSCECNSGYTMNGGTCSANCPAAGTNPYYSGHKISGSGTMPDPLCINGCQYDYGGPAIQTPAPNAYWSASVGGSRGTGTFCSVNTGTTSAGELPQNPPTSCPTGQCPGTVNGTNVCVACSGVPGSTTTITSGGSTTTKDASGTVTGTTTTTTTSVTTGGGGGGGTTTTTDTTVTKDAAGNVTGSTTKVTETKSDEFCKLNPTHASCKTSQFGGSCAAFTCDGDAVTCAIAKEVHRRNCTLFDGTTTEGTLYDSIKAGNDPNAALDPAAAANRTDHNLSGAISQTTFLAQTGLSDQTFTVKGVGITLPWSSLNYYLGLLGNLLVFAALMVAMRIVVTGRD